MPFFNKSIEQVHSNKDASEESDKDRIAERFVALFWRKKSMTDGQTDGRTDRQTDRPSYTDAYKISIIKT